MSTDEPILIRPDKSHIPAIDAFRKEFADSLDWLHGARGLRYMEDPSEWLDYSARLEGGLDGAAPYTQFVFVRPSSGKILGMLGVQHAPDGPVESWGGHVGYCVCPSERRKGYAEAMLRLALPYCRSIGLGRVLLTAGDENIGSVRTILKNGGVFEGYYISPKHGREIGRYWIDLN